MIADRDERLTAPMIKDGGEWKTVDWPTALDVDAHRGRLRYLGHQDAVKPALTVLENLALWQELVTVAAPHRVQWQWVRGHAGHPQNEYANDLAVRAAKEQTSSDGARTSEFDVWLEAQRVRKRVTVEPAPT